jgi:hypothetical protein
MHERVLLGQLEEAVGREQPVARVLPAHERLDAHDAARVEVDLGLEVQDELLGVGQGAAQLGDELQALAGVVVALGRVELDAGAALLGPVHRGVGVAQQVACGGRRAGGTARSRCSPGCAW